MNALILRNRFQGNTTLLDNDFIDQYMLTANGEYVKVYIFLVRHLNNPSISLTISQIADHLEHTEGDILRALKYWEKEHLLTLEYNAAGEVIALEMQSIPKKASCEPEALPSTTTPSLSQPSTDAGASAPVPAPEVTGTVAHASQKDRKELRQILFIAEQYLQKPLNRSDIDAISYFYETLDFSVDLIEYLIEYCVENGHKSMHYIKQVALNWAESKISTVEEARNTSAHYNKTCYAILNAFGIKGRGPATPELEMIEKWTKTDGFDLSIILEACNRTISAIHQPSFEYADKILINWNAKHAYTLKDIQKLDAAFEQQRSAQKTSPAPSSARTEQPKNSKFRNFEERSYDMNELTKELIHM